MAAINSCTVLNTILIILIIVKCISSGVLNLHNSKNVEQDANNAPGLYSTNDDVEILTIDNFKSQIYNSERAWFVEFYNSWCGFCQRFAPSWKALATDIKDWKDKIVIAAIDCSTDSNYPMCREFEIMAYPTLKYFHENYQEGPKNFGNKVEAGSDVDEHRQKLLDTIISEQIQGRGTMVSTILPFNDTNITQIFKSTAAETKFVFLIVQDTNSYLGQEVTLDLHNVNNMAVRFAYNNNTSLMKALNVERVPTLIAIKKDVNAPQILSYADQTRQGFKIAIRQYLEPEHITVPFTNKSNDIFSGKWLDAKVPDMSTFMREREREALKERIKKMGDVVFQMDLETALRYSLKHEVAATKTITGEKLEALKAYLSVLVKYFPFGKYGQSFLNELRDSVSYGNSIEGSQIADLVKDAEREDRQVFSSPTQWLGCKGSSPTYRGYPCGLWKIFHYLTINAADHNKDLRDANPREVLTAMHGYIKNFFGCADCSRHFQDMAARRELNKVNSFDSSILWLWRAHNEVNKRLSGDQTEDPEYPKYQFPAKQRCPQCYNSDNSWNDQESLKYLKHMYSSINVRYIGSDTRILHLGLEGSPASSGSSSIFQTIDTSMCLILYVASFVLIITLIRMFLKRGYRKKMYVHDLLGKV